MKKYFLYLLLLIVLLNSSCSKRESSGEQYLKLWLGPSANGNIYWKTVVDQWNMTGLGMKVVLETIPATGSTEEAIFNGIVSETIPDMTTNIFPGFGAQLFTLDAVYDLKKFDGFNELIAKRKMEKIIKTWEYKDHAPVFPIASNPMLLWWRMDILNELGCKTIPRTYDDVYKLAEKYTIPKKRYIFNILAGKNWWSRSADFIPFYYAASDGREYISNNAAVFNNEYGKAVLEFYKTMIDKGWCQAGFDSWSVFFEGVVLGEIKGPWDIEFTEVNHPDLMKKIAVGPILTPELEKTPYTVADSKGLVMFKTCKNPEDAWKFIKWVFEKDEFSLLRIEKTKICPARGDLLTNDVFKDFMEKNKIYAEYAKYVNYAIPTAPITKTIQVQKEMTKMIENIIYGKKTVDKSLKDSIRDIDNILEFSR